MITFLRSLYNMSVENPLQIKTTIHHGWGNAIVNKNLKQERALNPIKLVE